MIPIRDINPSGRFPAVTVAIILACTAGFLALGLVPMRYWKSFGNVKPETPPPAGPRRRVATT